MFFSEGLKARNSRLGPSLIYDMQFQSFRMLLPDYGLLQIYRRYFFFLGFVCYCLGIFFDTKLNAAYTFGSPGTLSEAWANHVARSQPRAGGPDNAWPRLALIPVYLRHASESFEFTSILSS